MNIRQAQKQFQFNDAVDRVVAQLAGLRSGTKIRVVTAVAKSLLLGSPYWYNGCAIEVSAKSVGAGVWEVWRNE